MSHLLLRRKDISLLKEVKKCEKLCYILNMKKAVAVFPRSVPHLEWFHQLGLVSFPYSLVTIPVKWDTWLSLSPHSLTSLSTIRVKFSDSRFKP